MPSRGTSGRVFPAMRRAKIVCTIGPASSDISMLRELARAGMDVARLNFSHGEHAVHGEVIRNLRKVSSELARPIAILQDLSGPKIRIGKLRERKAVQLVAGCTLCLECGDQDGGPERVYTSIDLAAEVRPGEPILLDDGLMELRVDAIEGRTVRCTVVAGGELREKKGINLPGSSLSIPAVTEKDLTDLEFGLEQGVDYVALSFVRSEQDVQILRERIRHFAGRNKGRGIDTPIIAKLEKPQAIERLSEILSFSDGVMVARGDLGVEVPPERVPGLQKRIINKAREHRLPVITATQMLESMTEHPRPTRAEASDVANAILDGTDAVMLSAETASGKYPVESVRMMARIIEEAESMARPIPQRRHGETLSIPETIAETVSHAAQDLHMGAIAVFTKGGSTARLVSNYRPRCPIYALAPDPRTQNRLALFWGVSPIPSPEILTTDEMLGKAERLLLDLRLVREGDVLAIVAGSPFGIAGRTNLMKILRAGE